MFPAISLDSKIILIQPLPQWHQDLADRAWIAIVQRPTIIFMSRIRWGWIDRGERVKQLSQSGENRNLSHNLVACGCIRLIDRTKQRREWKRSPPPRRCGRLNDLALCHFSTSAFTVAVSVPDKWTLVNYLSKVINQRCYGLQRFIPIFALHTCVIPKDLLY